MADGTKPKGSKRSSAGTAKRPRAKKAKGAAGAKAKKPARPKATRKPAAKELPTGPAASAALAGKAALEGTRAAGMAISLVASKVKVPLAVGGGLAAGAAGGLALVRRNGHRRRSRPDLGPVIAAAKHAGSIGEELGRLAAAAEQATSAKAK